MLHVLMFRRNYYSLALVLSDNNSLDRPNLAAWASIISLPILTYLNRLSLSVCMGALLSFSVTFYFEKLSELKNGRFWINLI